ncbi:MAG: 50S ribosomal protein L29 [Rubrobacteridae bacterium]|nr:50S ribosomal protein L29 [Rubrobacteridae bacterium]
MDAEKLRDLTEEELVDKLKSAKAELFNLRFQLATGQLDNSNRLKETKKDIARIQTVRKEREIEVKLSRS